MGPIRSQTGRATQEPRPAYSHHQAKQPGRAGGGGGGGGKPQRDLRGITGPERLTAPLPARTANKEKAAVLVTSLPPAPSAGCVQRLEEELMLATLGGVSMAGGAGAP